MANTKITNHIVDKTFISGLTAVTPVAGDYVVIGDTSDSNNLKKAPISSILAGTLTTAAQTNITSVGTLTSFRSTGIDDNADATAITIDSSEKVFVNGGVNITTTAGNTNLQVLTTNSQAADLGGSIGMGGVYNASNQITFAEIHGKKTNSTAANVHGYMAFVTRGDNIAERMRIDSAGKVGIGTTSPNGRLEVREGASDFDPESHIIISNDDIADGDLMGILFKQRNENDGKAWFGTERMGDYGVSDFVFLTDSAGDDNAVAATDEKMRITYDGKVGIGIESPTTPLHVSGGTGMTGGWGRTALLSHNFPFLVFESQYSSSAYAGIGYDNTTGLKFWVNSSSADITGSSGAALAMTILDNHNVGIGTASPSAKLHVNQTTVNEVGGFFYNNTSTNAACLRVLQDGAGSSGPALLVRQDGSGNAITVDDGSDGTTVFSVSQNGALSKASGSFKIDHPLDSKKDTHHLVHSFVEAPQADNIYRGTATLSGGTATVNLDTVSGMTEGTYVLLNTNTSCFTSNETDWDAVKGSVSGNILTITCQNSSSTATVSWLVIGERHDQHMKDADWTDNNGKVIVEPLKEAQDAE